MGLVEYDTFKRFQRKRDLEQKLADEGKSPEFCDYAGELVLDYDPREMQFEVIEHLSRMYADKWAEIVAKLSQTQFYLDGRIPRFRDLARIHEEILLPMTSEDPLFEPVLRLMAESLVNVQIEDELNGFDTERHNTILDLYGKLLEEY